MSKPAGHTEVYEALRDPRARILVFEKPILTKNGNRVARQAVFTEDGEELYRDGRKRSSWNYERDRNAFRARGGLVLSARAEPRD